MFYVRMKAFDQLQLAVHQVVCQCQRYLTEYSPCNHSVNLFIQRTPISQEDEEGDLSCTQLFQGPSFLPYSAEIFWRWLMLFLKWKWRVETTAHHSGSMPNPSGFTGPCCAQSSQADRKVPRVKVFYWCQHHFGLLEVTCYGFTWGRTRARGTCDPEVKCKKADFSMGTSTPRAGLFFLPGPPPQPQGSWV